MTHKLPADIFATKVGISSSPNLIPDEVGGIHRVEATMNAVIVQMIEAPQEDGTMEYQRVVSIMCKDLDMLSALKREAYRILEPRQL